MHRRSAGKNQKRPGGQGRGVSQFHVAARCGTKSETRNPKSEGNPKSERRHRSTRTQHQFQRRNRRPRSPLPFLHVPRFTPADHASDFEFRIWCRTLSGCRNRAASFADQKYEASCGGNRLATDRTAAIPPPAELPLDCWPGLRPAMIDEKPRTPAVTAAWAVPGLVGRTRARPGQDAAAKRNAVQKPAPPKTPFRSPRRRFRAFPAIM